MQSCKMSKIEPPKFQFNWCVTLSTDLLQKCETSNGDEEVEYKEPFEDINVDWESRRPFEMLLDDFIYNVFWGMTTKIEKQLG